MTHPCATLREYLMQLKDVAHVPLPPDETWPDVIARISIPGSVQEIDEETYEWFLDCLPPHWLGGKFFAFAEGAEALRLFWHDRSDGRYFVRQLTWDETKQFCQLARIRTPW